MYGSSLMNVTRKPRASSREPIEDAARPFPKLETTPPVTKMYLGIERFTSIQKSKVKRKKEKGSSRETRLNNVFGSPVLPFTLFLLPCHFRLPAPAVRPIRLPC